MEDALTEIGAEPRNNSTCWAARLPEEAIPFLYAIEEMARDGKRVNRRIAAEKFNELFDLPRAVSAGMVESHLRGNKGRGCACWKERNYL
jgi:hypothetical protein